MQNTIELHDIKVTGEDAMRIANDCIIKIGAARMDVARKKLHLAEADRDMSLALARAEYGVIEAAGGERELGPNAESRKRNLALLIAGDSGLIGAGNTYSSAYLQHEEAKATLESLQNYLKLLLVAGS